MKGTEKCQVYYNGLVMEECKACSGGGGGGGGGMEMDSVCSNGAALEK